MECPAVAHLLVGPKRLLVDQVAEAADTWLVGGDQGDPPG
jgi:hypothetical protein